jgi:hypothetical protein
LRIDYVVRRLRSCDVSIDRFVTDKFKTRYELEDLNVNAGLPLEEDHFVQLIRGAAGRRAGAGRLPHRLDLRLQSLAAALADHRRRARHQLHHQIVRPPLLPKREGGPVLHIQIATGRKNQIGRHAALSTLVAARTRATELVS